MSRIKKIRPAKSPEVRSLRHLAKVYADAWVEVKKLGYPHCPTTSVVTAYETARQRFYEKLDEVISRREIRDEDCIRS